MENEIVINTIAVVVAAVAHFAIGALWYSVLFGKAWMAAMDIPEEKMKELGEGATRGYIMTGIGTLMMSFVTAHIIFFMKAVRLGKWKGVRKYVFDGNLNLELYNVEADIQESHDVAPDYPAIVQKMEAIMKQEHVPSTIERFRFPQLGDN